MAAMNLRVAAGALLIAAVVSTDALAQVEIGVSASGLISIQPIDESYVGGPYLSEGIGGFGPAFGAGASVITRSGIVVLAEYTTARYEQEQSGRLVRGGFPLETIPATTKMRDSLFSVLAGYATSGPTRVMFLFGLSSRLDRATIEDIEADNYRDYGIEEKPLPVLTGGVTLLRPLSSRTQLVINGRYSFNERDERLQYLGIGPHIIRGGVGIRIRLN
jgi:hypothetical protein